MNETNMDLVSWMKSEALPFWVQRGVDDTYGGFIESLNPDGSISNVEFKRVRVQGRQLFCFSMAALLKWHDQAPKAAEQGYEFIKATCQISTGEWVSRIARDGKILDAQMNLYDTAFIILGLVTYYQLSQKQEVLQLVWKTLKRVQGSLISSSRLGYRQSQDEVSILRQNPHMHWFESMVFGFEVTQDERFLTEAKRMYQLAEQKLIDIPHGVLRELFNDQWNPIHENGKILVEPGHHYEWAWLILRAKNHMAVNENIAYQLLDFADQVGVNHETKLVYDQVSHQGEITQFTHRLWVQTEALKAWLVRKKITDQSRHIHVQQIEQNLFKYYLNCTPRGIWEDRITQNGIPSKELVPSSSMYHLMMGVVELWNWRKSHQEIS